MNQRDRSIYDSYPELIHSLVTWANSIVDCPLAEMYQANQRMGLTQAFIGPHNTQKVTPELLASHRALFDLVVDFRDRFVELARTAGADG
jgi:hypothetical protein